MHDHRASHAGAGGCGRSSAIIRKISWNICRGMATSAVWKATLRADLDQLLLRARQRPILDRRRRRQRAQEIAEIIGERVKLKPHRIGGERRASARASQAAPAFIAESKRIAIPKENTATRTAALVLPTTGDNHARHAALQRFMLANDSTTVAVEVPIWLRAH